VVAIIIVIVIWQILKRIKKKRRYSWDDDFDTFKPTKRDYHVLKTDTRGGEN